MNARGCEFVFAINDRNANRIATSEGSHFESVGTSPLTKFTQSVGKKVAYHLYSIYDIIFYHYLKSYDIVYLKIDSIDHLIPYQICKFRF